jgi:hypothetical protein
LFPVSLHQKDEGAPLVKLHSGKHLFRPTIVAAVAAAATVVVVVVVVVAAAVAVVI